MATGVESSLFVYSQRRRTFRVNEGPWPCVAFGYWLHFWIQLLLCIKRRGLAGATAAADDDDDDDDDNDDTSTCACAYAAEQLNDF